MTPLEMIAEWRRGCSCAPHGTPEECQACTRALIDAVERALRAQFTFDLPGSLVSTDGGLTWQPVPPVDTTAAIAALLNPD